MPSSRLIPILLCLCVMLAACGGDKKPGARRVDGVADETLPAPAGKPRGSVTGMPSKPGPGQIGLPPEAQPQVALDENGNPLPPEALPADGTPPEAGVAPDAPIAADAPVAATEPEPTPQDAVAVVRDYYAAINSRNFARAYSLWSDAGRASGQSPQQFASGFDNTTGVSVEIMAPGRVDAGAGSRFIEVPVSFTATTTDGRQRRFVGAYTLRRGVVDGATAEQRAWRIASADLREVAQ